MRMLLISVQAAQNIGFSQVNASCLSPVPFFLFPNSQLIPKCTKHCVFTGKCNLCASRPIFFYSLIRNLFQIAKNIVFSQINAACVSHPIFSFFPNSQLFPTCAKHCVFTGRCACLSRPICSYSLFPNSRLIRLTWPCQWILQLEQHGTAPN